MIAISEFSSSIKQFWTLNSELLSKLIWNMIAISEFSSSVEQFWILSSELLSKLIWNMIAVSKFLILVFKIVLQCWIMNSESSSLSSSVYEVLIILNALTKSDEIESSFWSRFSDLILQWMMFSSSELKNIVTYSLNIFTILQMLK